MSDHTILLVEDDKHDVFFFQHAMETAGITHSLRVARNVHKGSSVFSHATARTRAR